MCVKYFEPGLNYELNTNEKTVKVPVNIVE